MNLWWLKIVSLVLSAIAIIISSIVIYRAGGGRKTIAQRQKQDEALKKQLMSLLKYGRDDEA